jgi:hypothetical protein
LGNNNSKNLGKILLQTGVLRTMFSYLGKMGKRENRKYRIII